jgi:N-glycosylase/DNA lyase
MDKNSIEFKNLLEIYPRIQNRVEERLKEFDEIFRTGSDKDIFVELSFCLLTPQSKAKVCWSVIEELLSKNLIFEGNRQKLVKVLNVVRFKNNKTQYLLEAREKFFGKNAIPLKSTIAELKNDYLRRDWIVKNVKGLGYKEASHFLRNIGFYNNLAILDRHVLRNLDKLGIIDEIPKSITKKRYLDMEKKMKSFAKKINIPLPYLDFLLWYKETGEIFK